LNEIDAHLAQPLKINKLNYFDLNIKSGGVTQRNLTTSISMQVYIVVCVSRHDSSNCRVHKIVATESEAYEIAYEKQNQWISTFMVDTGLAKKKKLDSGTNGTEHVWCKEDMDKLYAAYKEELDELNYDCWSVHPHTLDLNELCLIQVEF
jgi:hypothetical protein